VTCILQLVSSPPGAGDPISLWVKPPFGDFVGVTTSALNIDSLKADVIAQLSLTDRLRQFVNLHLSDASGAVLGAPLRPFHKLAEAGVAAEAFLVVAYAVDPSAAASGE